MTAPVRARILAENWTIEYHPNLYGDDGSVELGQTDEDVYTIRIKHGPLQQMRKVLLHELIHVADHRGQIGLTEEQIVHLENQLFAILSDNPKLRTWIFKP